MRATPFQGQLRQHLHREMQKARMRSDEIFNMLQAEALYARPIAERHRPVFYLGHLETFDWNLICSGVFHMKSMNPEFDQLFAFGIDPTNGKLPQDTPEEWPRREEIRNYNHRVRAALDDCLDRSSDPYPDRPIDDSLFHVAIEHRLMHAETLAYMLHRLPYSMKKVPVGPLTSVSNSAPPPAHRRMTVREGIATLGMDKRSECFGWDNEFHAHEVHVPEFEMDRYKVTNGQYLEFVNDGGYENPSLWDASSWEWITSAGIRYPNFWEPSGNSGPSGNAWRNRTMFADVEFQSSWPVYVSHAEADAYCRWKKAALPTEAQYHRAAFGTPEGGERPFPWGSETPQRHHGNFDFHQWDPTPVDVYPEGASAFGVADLMGNGWEWTSTVFEPFPGFQRFPFYPGYSADFFDGKHYVMKGGSPRTSAMLLRRSFRNWFQPRYPYIYASFRCVQS